MSEILLATLNSRYIHTAFGLRCLYANLGELQARCAIQEYDIKQRPVDIAEALLANRPKIIGLGIYIWNVEPSTELVEILKQLAPEVVIVLGGPEVSYETDRQRIIALADHVITGEADLAFGGLCRRLLAGDTPPKIIAAQLPVLTDLAFPYDAYRDEDIAHRVLYVEASRGCPFSCEFCLSSVDIPVRSFPLDGFLAEMAKLIERGASQFKFLDRTFNLNLQTSAAILQFFLDRWRPGMFYHFEMVPDRFPEALRGLIAQFPPGALQFEVGIQTFHPVTSALISRRQNLERLEANLTFLRGQTGVHVHADLIVGLPGEDLASFGAGFDRLLRLGPQEIQVGILKRLRGTPIGRHDQEFGMIYAQRAPYELLCNRELDFTTMQRLKRFARFWDLVGNSGRFSRTLPILLEQGPAESPFANFMTFAERLFARHAKQHGISPDHLGEALYQLLAEWGVPHALLIEALAADHRAMGSRNPPLYLTRLQRPAADRTETPPPAGLPRRQQRHLGTESP